MSWKDYISAVEKLYVSYLGRPADPAGLRYWSEVVEKYGIDVAIGSFANSLEAQSIYFFNDPEEVIVKAYENLFERYPSYYEIFFWESVCQDPKKLVWEIANSAQGFDRYVLEYKIKAATDFTSSIDPDLNGLPPFCAEYSGDIDILLGKEFLSEVIEKGEIIIADFVEKMKDYSTLSDSLISGFRWNKSIITY